MALWRGFDSSGQRIYKFKNGYGASVINYGYGAQAGLYELAVFDENQNLIYDTPITPDRDVLGWLTKAEVETTLSRISKLPKRTRQSMVARLDDDDERTIDLGPQLPGVRHPTRFRRRPEPEVRVSTHVRRARK